MFAHHEFARELHIDLARLNVLIDRGWIRPIELDGTPMFQDVDLARASLIADLADDMGVNDEGIDLVLDLLDQLYSLRFAFNNLIDALEVQPRGTRRRVVNDAHKLNALTRLATRSFRQA
jgi:chaperone modulatory protein CbpM